MDLENPKSAGEWTFGIILVLTYGVLFYMALHWWGKWAVLLVILGIALLVLIVKALVGFLCLLSDIFGGRL